MIVWFWDPSFRTEDNWGTHMQLLQKVKMLTDAPEGKNHALRGSKEKHFLYFAQISYFF